MLKGGLKKQKMNKEIKQEFKSIWGKIRELEIKIGGKNEPKIKTENLDNNLEEEIGVFCKNNNLDLDKLKYEIDFQEDLPRLINIPKEKVRTKLQFSTIILLAPIIYRIYKKILSEEIMRALFELNRIPQERMDKLYDSPPFKKYFTKSGTSIKLSWAGELEGVKNIKQLIENETNT